MVLDSISFMLPGHLRPPLILLLMIMEISTQAAWLLANCILVFQVAQSHLVDFGNQRSRVKVNGQSKMQVHGNNPSMRCQMSSRLQSI